MTDTQQKSAARKFAAYWKDKGYEKGQSQTFWLTLLSDVLGVEDVGGFITFEEQVKLDHTSFIDGIIPSTHVLIEQKSIDKNLKAAIKQSDGSLLSPFQQAKRYAAELPYSQRPRWIVICNFAEFHVYDMERPGGDPGQMRKLRRMHLKEYQRCLKLPLENILEKTPGINTSETPQMDGIDMIHVLRSLFMMIMVRWNVTTCFMHPC